jgi:hypothetical protein
MLEPNSELLSGYWIAGFIAGEGSFSVTINEKINIQNANRKINPQIRSRFTIGLHERDKDILIKIKNYFNEGYLYSNNQGTSVIEISKLDSIKTKLIPFFNEYCLNNVKNLDFLDFKEIIFLIDKGQHLNECGLNKIREIKSRMNLNRK